MPLVRNQQLFSEAYLRELREAKHPAGVSADTVRAMRQTIRDWRDEYSSLDTAAVARRYVGQCLSTLGLSYSQRPDGFTLFADDSFGESVGLVLIVDDADLGRTTKGLHHQHNIVRELRSAALDWGILTNGSAWRLCHASAPAPYELFLQADLDALIRGDDLIGFALFYRFFGREAFTVVSASSPSVANGVSSRQRVALDLYAEESERRVDVIQRHLRARVEPILQSLCLGFVQDEAAGTYSPDKLDEIYRNSIYLLYRILFLFYAEARELMPVGQPLYDQASLAAILADARKRQQEGVVSDDALSLWKRLTHLFVIVDDGDESLGVRPYNGGLFSDTEKPYLKAHKIADAYLAPALFELGYAQTKTSTQPIDYRDLSVRQLGTLYEGLLEYRLNLVEREPVVVRESGGKRLYISQSEAGPIKKNETILDVGQVYFADDKGERKQSGSYYTPEDVVQYIVTNTVGPKLAERRAPLEALLQQVARERDVAPTDEERVRVERYADQKALETVERDILGLRILDPAMGSAHFLVAAGQMVTDAIIETLNATSWPNDSISTDPLTWKRRVVERCLYGVDLNPLAQELAKLALWISSASVGKPLTFLDHHLKVGNSLYGAPLSRLSRLPTSKRVTTPGMNDMFAVQREQVVAEALRQMAYITHTDSDRIEDVKHKGEANRTAEDVTTRLRDVSNVWLATLFGLESGNGGPVTDTEYEGLLNDLLINYAPAAWESKVQNTHALSEARRLADLEHESFFHWELEFPDAVVDGACRFDAIIANPPYVGTSPNMAIRALYETAKAGDLYAWIFERALLATNNATRIGMIIPISLLFDRSFGNLRKLLIYGDYQLRLSSYDNIPDSLFNTSSEGGDSKSMQRVTIVIAQASSGCGRIETTDLLRWWRKDRPLLFENLCFADTTELSSEVAIPRMGNSLLVPFWKRMKAMRSSIRNLSLELFSEARRPHPDSIYLTVPRIVAYFISATPGSMPRSGVLSLTFRSQNDMDLARVLLNSNVFFWYSRCFGDGFHLNVDLLGDFPIPDVMDDGYLNLAYQLDVIAEECATYRMYAGQEIRGYNFNSRPDILLAIDDWIVRHVAPDLDLPRDIFMQYKSNSFLRPLDISALVGAEENMVEAR